MTIHFTLKNIRVPRRIPLHLTVLVAVLGLLTFNGGGCADVYRWKDAGGQTHYTDRAEPGAEKRPISADRPSASIAPTSGDTYVVSRVYDGDTITLQGGIKVRLLGINTPEVEGISKHDEPGGEAARLWLRKRLEKHSVRIQTDAVTHDKYQRLLAHVFTLEGEHVNLKLVEEGLATTDIFPPNLAYVDALVAAENRAQRARKGLWALPEYQPKALTEHGKISDTGWQRLTGTISDITGSKNYQSFQLGPQNNTLELRVPNENLPLFPPPSAYRDYRVEARGWPNCKRSGCFMYVKHPSALIRLD